MHVHALSKLYASRWTCVSSNDDRRSQLQTKSTCYNLRLVNFSCAALRQSQGDKQSIVLLSYGHSKPPGAASYKARTARCILAQRKLPKDIMKLGTGRWMHRWKRHVVLIYCTNNKTFHKQQQPRARYEAFVRVAQQIYFITAPNGSSQEGKDCGLTDMRCKLSALV